MFKAKTVMTTDILFVKRSTPIYEAMRILVDKNITGLYGSRRPCGPDYKKR